MKKIFVNSFLVAIAGLSFVGCRESGASNIDTPNPTDITVERGPVIGAYVVDDSGKRAISLGGGQYRFSVSPTYPITAYGGYIDVNRDGVIDGNDTTLPMPLSLSSQNRNKLTILTTLATNDELKNRILTNYGLNEEELFTLTPATSLKISAISDEVFKYCVENNATVDDINLTTFASLEDAIDTKITTFQNSSDSLLEIATQNEITLVGELNITLASSDTNLTVVANTITQSGTQTNDPTVMLNTLPMATLTEEQKDGLVFMYQEEKVARDVYNEMYVKWGSKVFANIAKSEQSHMDAVKAILEKYDLEVPVVSDTVGEFDLEKLRELYYDLIASGNVSSNEAMKVGVLVEQTDIADLIERMVDVPEDIKIVYQSLLNGSYNHLNAFSKQVH